MAVNGFRWSPSEEQSTLFKEWSGHCVGYLVTCKDGVRVRRISNELEAISGETIPVRKMGFPSVNHFLHAMAKYLDVCEYTDPVTRRKELIVFVKETSVPIHMKHIRDEVRRQASAKTKKTKSGVKIKLSRGLSVPVSSSELIRQARVTLPNRPLQQDQARPVAPQFNRPFQQNQPRSAALGSNRPFQQNQPRSAALGSNRPLQQNQPKPLAPRNNIAVTSGPTPTTSYAASKYPPVTRVLRDPLGSSQDVRFLNKATDTSSRAQLPLKVKGVGVISGQPVLTNIVKSKAPVCNGIDEVDGVLSRKAPEPSPFKGATVKATSSVESKGNKPKSPSRADSRIVSSTLNGSFQVTITPGKSDLCTKSASNSVPGNSNNFDLRSVLDKKCSATVTSNSNGVKPTPITSDPVRSDQVSQQVVEKPKLVPSVQIDPPLKTLDMKELQTCQTRSTNKYGHKTRVEKINYTECDDDLPSSPIIDYTVNRGYTLEKIMNKTTLIDHVPIISFPKVIPEDYRSVKTVLESYYQKDMNSNEFCWGWNGSGYFLEDVNSLA